MNQGTSFRYLLLVLQLVLLPAVTQGKKVVLGEEGKMAELPCKASQKKIVSFNWKYHNETRILRNQDSFCVKGPTGLKYRLECRPSQWDQGSFPLIINNLQMSDSGHYICEIENKKEEVQLLVFKLTVRPGVRLLQGHNLTLTLEGPSGSNPSVEWKGPLDKSKNSNKNLKSFPVSWLGSQHSGTWTCTVSLNQKTLELRVNILVLAFQKAVNTVYKKHGEQVQFSFPLNFQDEDLNGELRWQERGTSSLKPWIIFSVKEKKVSVASVIDKFKMNEMLPLILTLPQALPQYAGSGNLILNLAMGTIQQKVNLVVMSVTQPQNNLVCEILGPISSTMTLSLQLENKTAKISKPQNMVQVLDPEAGTWLCLLSDKDKILLESKTEVLSKDKFLESFVVLLATGLGLGLLFSLGLCIVCYVRCRHRRRQAQRMSQIKRLLSEKKTCQCPHRFQKTRSLI
ncbi:PREDICTED: T-cell surface glycoprotein CD4 [Chrysochloris asiatica]|uniref:T-cell surface glycoprotein CD4 n=1 Tax=Chrysochloris asiatica TaxID=185453 RepID=A0A9B0WN77_CHRAS|nr:PREDICTED: T-cell surface glycoprotein CD4 [Chrysochloris asiatica]